MRNRVKYSAILGHELPSVVEKVKSRATWLNEGDEVVTNPVIPCGICPSCLAGRPNICINFKILGVNVPWIFCRICRDMGKMSIEFQEISHFEMLL